jgi:hypothetical protein
MLIRLLIALTFVGPPGGPRICTWCAVAKAVSVPTPVAPAPALLPVKVKSCRCGHHAHQSQPSKHPTFVCQPANDHNPAAPTGHEPNCPAAHPCPALSACVPSIVLSAETDSISAAVEGPNAPHVNAICEFCGLDPPVPRVPLFITFLNLRN